MLRFAIGMILAGAAIPGTGAAQNPRVHPVEPMYEVPSIDRAAIEDQVRQVELMEQRASQRASQLDVQALQMQARDLAMLDAGRMRLEAEEVSRRAMMELPMALESLPMVLESLPMALESLPMAFESLRMFGQGDRLLNSQPPRPWAKDDPADSLYRVAREALNRGEYRRAAQLFSEVTRRFPKSQYAQDCAYWEAFSRYRSGGTDDLRQALKILEGIDIDAMMRVGRESAVDIPALRARLQGALAARGDEKAAADLRRDLAQSGGCDREEMSVRAEALSALAQMDHAAAMPAVRKVLARRDECTVELRRRALYVLGRQDDSSTASLILDVAKNDTDAGIRGEAMRWLPRVAGDNAVPALEDVLRTSKSEESQRSAIYALSSIDSDRARHAVRAIIERPDAAERVRYEAILSLSRDREGKSVSADDMTYLRGLYRKLDTPRLREAVLTSVSRVETPGNSQFLVSIARDQSEATPLRAAALQRLGRMESVGAGEIAKLYDIADARSLREQILYALSQRKEPEAIDKMMEVARKDTDPNIRRTAISLLARSNNERAKQLLKELIDK